MRWNHSPRVWHALPLGPFTRRFIFGFCYLSLPFLSVTKLYAQTSHSETDRGSSTQLKTAPLSQALPAGTAADLYLGLDLGGVPVYSQNRDTESSKLGYLVGVKGIGSVYLRSTVLDLGGGWFQSRVRSREVVETLPGRAPTDVRYITTRTGFGEASARVKLGENSEVGPLVTVTFNNDSKFAPLASEKEANVFLGASLLKSNRTQSGAFRWGVNLLTDISIKNRQVYLLNFTAQAGVPLLRPEPRVVQVIKEVETLKVVERPQVQAVLNQSVSAAEIMGQIINFDTAKASLNANDLAYMEQLAKLLNARKSQWQSVEITGHADQRGSVQVNAAVSASRAATARRVLLGMGLAQDRVVAKGQGVSGLVSSRSDVLSLARNRRAEIKILGVAPESDLEQEIESLRRKFYTPSTCTQLHCR